VLPGFPPADANGVGGTKARHLAAASPLGTYQVTTTKTTKGNVNVTLDAVQGAATTDNPVKLGNDPNGQFSYALTDAQPTKTIAVVPRTSADQIPQRQESRQQQFAKTPKVTRFFPRSSRNSKHFTVARTPPLPATMAAAWFCTSHPGRF